MSPESVAIRRADPADGPVVGDVYLRSWRAGYDGLVDDELLAPALAQRAAFDWTENLRRPDLDLLIADVDGLPAGIAAVGLDPDEDDGHWLELLYVLPEHWGAGVAVALLDAAVALAPTELALRVVEEQHRARRFYERQGWEYDHDAPPRSNAFFRLLCMRAGRSGGTVG